MDYGDWYKNDETLILYRNDIILGFIKNDILHKKIFTIGDLYEVDDIIEKNGFIKDHSLFEIIKPYRKKKLSFMFNNKSTIKKIDFKNFIKSICNFKKVVIEIKHDVLVLKNSDYIQIMFHDLIMLNSHEEKQFWIDYSNSKFRHHLFDDIIKENYEFMRTWYLPYQNGGVIKQGGNSSKLTNSLCGYYDD